MRRHSPVFGSLLRSSSVSSTECIPMEACSGINAKSEFWEISSLNEQPLEWCRYRYMYIYQQLAISFQNSAIFFFLKNDWKSSESNGLIFKKYKYVLVSVDVFVLLEALDWFNGKKWVNWMHSWDILQK